VINKEVRALLPVWTVCATSILASRWQVGPLRSLGLPAYFIATAALGAWSVGHEHVYGTLPSLLTLPVARRRLWLIKLAVLASMLAPLAILARYCVPLDRGDQDFGVALFVLSAAAGLCLAPWLTMLARTPLGGAVFSFGAVGGAMALGEWIGVLRYGFTREVDAFRISFMWWAVGALCLVGATMGWRTFARLEARDGSQDVQLPFARPRLNAPSTVTRRHPLVCLITKELRLQQLAIVVAILWVLAYVFSEAAGLRVGSQGGPDSISVLTVFYTLVLPVVIGSLACAEERHFGTLESQLLLPIRSATQWVVKSATALSLALALAVLVPFALARVFGDRLAFAAPRDRLEPTAIFFVLALTTISLYVSTLARSGLRALIGSVGAVLAFGVFARELDPWLNRKDFLVVREVAHGYAPRGLFVTGVQLMGWLFYGFFMLTLALAFPHFRYVARRPALVAAHVAILALYVVAYDVMMHVISGLRFH